MDVRNAAARKREFASLPDAPPATGFAVVPENIARFRSLLQHGANRPDERTKRTVKLLLAEEEAKRVTLDKTRTYPLNHYRPAEA